MRTWLGRSLRVKLKHRPLGSLRLRPLELGTRNYGTKPSDPLESAVLIFNPHQKGRSCEVGGVAGLGFKCCDHQGTASGPRIQKKKFTERTLSYVN
jgi:hypothetical protein